MQQMMETVKQIIDMVTRIMKLEFGSDEESRAVLEYEDWGYSLSLLMVAMVIGRATRRIGTILRRVDILFRI